MALEANSPSLHEAKVQNDLCRMIQRRRSVCWRRQGRRRRLLPELPAWRPRLPKLAGVNPRSPPILPLPPLPHPCLSLTSNLAVSHFPRFPPPPSPPLAYPPPPPTPLSVVSLFRRKIPCLLHGCLKHFKLTDCHSRGVVIVDLLTLCLPTQYL